MMERVRVWLLAAGMGVLLAACGSDETSGLRRPLKGTGGQDAGASGSSGADGGALGNGGAGTGGRGSGGGVVADPPCKNSLDCAGSGAKAICNPATRVCVECVQTADCEVRQDCINNTCFTYTPCTNSLGCSNGQVCNTGIGKCVDCVGDGDCPADSACIATLCQKKCTSDKTCTPLGLLCNTAAGVCAQCLVDADCGANRNCNAGTCANRACTPLSTTCNGDLVLTCGSRGEGYTGSVSCAPAICTTVSGVATCAAGTGGSTGTGGIGNGGDAGAAGFAGAGGVSSGGAGGAATGGAGGEPAVTKHILLIGDATGSMISTGGTGVSKWQELMDGLNAFISDPASATIAAAFQIFPVATGGICDGVAYETPLVPMGPLGPGTATTQAISAALPTHQPGVFTGAFQSDIEAVLRGATAFCATHRQNTGQDCSIVFVTDGSPTACSADTAVLAQITGDAFTGSGVKTWVIGLAAADFVQLDEIARQGGTDCDPPATPYSCNASGASPTLPALLGYVRDHL